MSLSSGSGTAKTTGAITISSRDAGVNGVSGSLVFRTGTTSLGSSGQVSITVQVSLHQDKQVKLH